MEKLITGLLALTFVVMTAVVLKTVFNVFYG